MPAELAPRQAMPPGQRDQVEFPAVRRPSVSRDQRAIADLRSVASAAGLGDAAALTTRWIRSPGCGGWSRFPPLGGGAEAVNQALLGRGGHLVRQHASSVGRQ